MPAALGGLFLAALGSGSACLTPLDARHNRGKAKRCVFSLPRTFLYQRLMLSLLARPKTPVRRPTPARAMMLGGMWDSDVQDEW